jgi:hypothetical protein
MPAASAAAISPMLWPRTMAGARPSCARQRVVATWIANMSGWATLVLLRRAAMPELNIVSARDQPARPRKMRSIALNCARKTGFAS